MVKFKKRVIELGDELHIFICDIKLDLFELTNNEKWMYLMNVFEKNNKLKLFKVKLSTV